MSKMIPLTQGKFAIVDDEDFEYLNQWKWYYGTGYARRNGKKKDPTKIIKMHRSIMNFPKNKVVDHINRNKLDNRKCNLRITTSSVNNRNRKKQETESGYIGVRRDKRNKKTSRNPKIWNSHLCINYRMKSIGCFSTPEEAALARDIYILNNKLEGFILNFPLEKKA